MEFMVIHICVEIVGGGNWILVIVLVMMTLKILVEVSR